MEEMFKITTMEKTDFNKVTFLHGFFILLLSYVVCLWKDLEPSIDIETASVSNFVIQNCLTI